MNKIAFCKNGHPLDDSSNYGNQGRRRCLICANQKQRLKRKIEKKNKPIRQRDYEIPPTRDLHWAAGLFEGEGTVTISGRKEHDAYTREIISVANTDKEVITFFHTRWGGYFKEQPKQPTHRTVYVWAISSYRAEFFVRDVLPYIRTNRVKVKMQLLLESRSIKRPGTRSQEYLDRALSIRNRMKELNKRGC